MANLTAEAFEDGIELQIGLLEAFIPDNLASWQAYPFLPLKPSGDEEMRTFRTILLENPYLRVTILPGLGGRIISIIDKRSGQEILRRHPMLEPQLGGKRGAFVREGVQLLLDGQERLNSLGNVSSQFDQPAEEESEAAVWLAETFTGTGLAFHQRLSVPPDRAEIRIEVRVSNRSLRSEIYNGGLSLYLGAGSFDGSVFYSDERDAGIAFISEDQLFEGSRLADGVLQVSRFCSPKLLAPRQTDNWSVTLVPLSGLTGCVGGSREAAAAIVDQTLKVQVTEQRLGHKLLMLTEDGQTLEAVVDLYPEHLLEIPLEGLKPIEFVLRDRSKAEILRVGASMQSWGPTGSGATESVDVLEISGLSTSTSEVDLKRATFDIGKRHLAHTLLGMRALAQQRNADAGLAFEHALGFNADDPLLWWAKAVAARLDGQDNQDELLNAHFLAPLEPALRAESFLSQPINTDPEPNRLLVALEENPEEFIDVACLLIESGLFDQAVRWIDEAIRHRDLPMLRYLMAYCFLIKTPHNAEAFDHMRTAAKSPIAPPFPFREVEKQAIQRLTETFPTDRNLATFASYIAAR